MIIHSIHVKKFRSIYDQVLYCDPLTALVGRNGSGKSSVLSAIEHFYATAVYVVAADFYDEDTSQDVEIILTFSGLTTAERERFSKYVSGDRLTVAKIFSMGSSGKVIAAYHGEILQHPGFADVRNAGGKGPILAKYRELHQNEQYQSLPTVTSAANALLELETWESAHPEQCVLMRDNGKFFGFAGVGQGYLGYFTKFIKVPAVRDAAADAAEGRGSCITEIMDLVVRSSLKSGDFTRLQDQTRIELERLLDPTRKGELGDLQTGLTKTLQQYVSDASVSIEWSDLEALSIPTPKAKVSLLEDGYKTTVERTGHGLQRAFILTLLQHLMAAREHQSEDPNTTAVHRIPNLVLAVEEPELYQHPSRQRHLASVLRRLAEGSISSVAHRTQVIYTTHAPLFVGLDRFDQIRILRKENHNRGRPKVTVTSMTTMEKVAQTLWDRSGRPSTPFTPESLRTRMQAIMTPWVNEGFFADIAVLVEGEADRAAILAIAESMEHELPSMGVAVIPCGGKTNLDRPAIVFGELGIRTYVIWDNDENTSPRSRHDATTNRRLLRIVGAPEEDWPTGVEDTYACLHVDLPSTLRDELPPKVFDELLTNVASEYGVKRKDADKNPTVLHALIREATRSGHPIPTLEAIAERIVTAAVNLAPRRVNG